MKATDGYTAGSSLDNYARVDLTRNGGGDGLEDHDEDQVTQTAKAVTAPPTNLDQTGRNVIIGPRRRGGGSRGAHLPPLPRLSGPRSRRRRG